jgi:RNA polymerase sigma factor (sigma-70 family)
MAVQPKNRHREQRAGPGPPKAKLPSATVLKSLEDSDLDVLRGVLDDPPEYMDHPDLHRKNAEEHLFGAAAKYVKAGAARFAPPEPVVKVSPTAGSAIPTLSPKQEVQLFLRMNYARMRVRAALERFDGKRLKGPATREIIAWWHRAREARSEIVRMNVPLVLAMAKRTRLNSIDFNELVSEGNMALLRSVDKFDCGRGFKFSTYSCRAILKSFSRVAMRISRYRGRFPTEFDPALEQDTYLEDQRQDVEGDCVDELKSILLRNYADLSEIEQTVIRERFALSSLYPETTGPKTLEEVGLIIGVTKERVRQIQNKALRKIRHALEERYLAA